MSEQHVHDRRFSMLGGPYWWVGLLILIGLLVLFASRFFDDVSQAFTDPVLLLSVIAVGLAIIAPFFWIANEARSALARKQRRGGTVRERVFEVLRTASEPLTAFENIRLPGGPLFDFVVIGKGVTFVLVVVENSYPPQQYSDETLRRSADIFERFLKKQGARGVRVRTVVVAQTCDHEAQKRSVACVEPDLLVDTLKTGDRSTFAFDSDSRLRTVLDDLWQGKYRV